MGTNYSIFMRKTDGSPAVRLGDGGFGASLSGWQWVVAERGDPGEADAAAHRRRRTAQLTDNKLDHYGVAWLPDGKSIIFTAAEPGHGRAHLLRVDLRAAPARADSRRHGR